MFGELRFFVDLGGQYTQGLGGERSRRVGLSTNGIIFLACVAAAVGGSLVYFR